MGQNISPASAVIISKIDEQGKPTVCSIHDAVQLVRLIMAQEGVERCETDLQNQLLRLVTRPDLNGIAVLQRTDVKEKMEKMGFRLDTNTLPTEPAVASKKESKNAKNNAAKTQTKPQAKPDCENCGEQKVKEDVKNAVLQNANYGSELLINIPMGDADDGSYEGYENDFLDETPAEAPNLSPNNTAAKTGAPIQQSNNNAPTPNPASAIQKYPSSNPPARTNGVVIINSEDIYPQSLPQTGDATIVVPAQKYLPPNSPAQSNETPVQFKRSLGSVSENTHTTAPNTQVQPSNTPKTNPVATKPPITTPAGSPKTLATSPATKLTPATTTTKPAPKPTPEKESQLDSLRRILFKRPK